MGEKLASRRRETSRAVLFVREPRREHTESFIKKKNEKKTFVYCEHKRIIAVDWSFLRS